MTVYVQAVHTVRPLRGDLFDRWVDFYANDALPRMARHGFEVVGAWKRSTGRLNQDLVLTRFESLAAYEKASASMFADVEFGKAIGALLCELQLEEEITIGNPVPYADEQRLERALAERPAAPRQYLLATLPVVLGRSPKAHRLIGEAVALVEGIGMMKLVTAYEAATGLRDVLNDFWVMPDRPLDLGYRPTGGSSDLITSLREVAPEEEFTYLNPLPFSPLQ
jgi:hypothetical protein